MWMISPAPATVLEITGFAVQLVTLPNFLSCGPQKLHPTVFRPHVTLLHPDRLVTRLSFLLFKVADFKGVQGG